MAVHHQSNVTQRAGQAVLTPDHFGAGAAEEDDGAVGIDVLDAGSEGQAGRGDGDDLHAGGVEGAVDLLEMVAPGSDQKDAGRGGGLRFAGEVEGEIAVFGDGETLGLKAQGGAGGMRIGGGDFPFDRHEPAGGDADDGAVGAEAVLAEERRERLTDCLGAVDGEVVGEHEGGGAADGALVAGDSHLCAGDCAITYRQAQI